MRSAREGPSTSSMTIARDPSRSSRPWMVAMFGWLSDASEPCLALEADAALGARAHAFGQHLDRDVTVQPRIGGAIDLAHPARAEERDDLVRADSGSRNQRHECCTLSRSGKRRLRSAVIISERMIRTAASRS